MPYGMHHRNRPINAYRRIWRPLHLLDRTTVPSAGSDNDLINYRLKNHNLLLPRCIATIATSQPTKKNERECTKYANVSTTTTACRHLQISSLSRTHSPRAPTDRPTRDNTLWFVNAVKLFRHGLDELAVADDGRRNFYSCTKYLH